MTIEVRQLLIHSTVAGDSAPVQRLGESGASTEDLERLKQEIMAECKAWLGEKLQQVRER